MARDADVRTPRDAEWLEFDDSHRFYVGRTGCGIFRQASTRGVGAGPLVVVLRPVEEIEFRCALCWPPEAQRCYGPVDRGSQIDGLPDWLA
jgi:hypothetical protein